MMDDEKRDTAGSIRLIVMAGPPLPAITLTPPGPVRIGRRSTSDVHLQHELVSRDHAEARPRASDPAVRGWRTGAQWLLYDLSSKHGVYVNSERLSPGTPFPLCAGDRIRIDPWEFRIAGGDAQQTWHGSRTSTLADGPSAQLQTIVARTQRQITKERLDALFALTDALHSADNERRLAEILTTAATEAAGFENAVFVTSFSSDGEATLLEFAGPASAKNSAPELSRSLLRVAWQGEPATITEDTRPAAAHSVIELDIRSAIAAPLLVDGVVRACLYADVRRRNTLDADAQGFFLGLSRIGALALANLRRLEIEREHTRLEADLVAAGAAHRWMQPPGEGVIGPLRYAAESRPGRTTLGGDFFDVIEFGQGVAAFAVGDVVGKGVAASVLMTATQAYLHASILRHGSPEKAVGDLQAFLTPRLRDGRFVTLWVGVLDTQRNTLRYVDAGHGYAALVTDASLMPLREGSQPPVGVDPAAHCDAVEIALPATGALCIVSDGVVEQPGVCVDSNARRDFFGFDQAVRLLTKATTPQAGVDEIFRALETHAGGPALADDVTCVLAAW